MTIDVVLYNINEKIIAADEEITHYTYFQQFLILEEMLIVTEV
jgi:hypothetical protein